MKNDLETNTSRRLPIVLCLDVSPSMNLNNRIQNLNHAIKVLYSELKKEPKVVNSAEIAIITFSTDIILDTDFEYLDSIANKTFTTASGGTNLSNAVLASIKKIENRVIELRNGEIGHYLPFLVLVTDGDPEKSDNQTNLEQAIKAVQLHCVKNNVNNCLIAPYIIGVGNDVAEESLNRFAEKFTGTAVIIDDVNEQKNLFKELFTFIANSIIDTLGGTGDLGGLYDHLSKVSTDLNQEFKRKQRKLL